MKNTPQKAENWTHLFCISAAAAAAATKQRLTGSAPQMEQVRQKWSADSEIESAREERRTA